MIEKVSETVSHINFWFTGVFNTVILGVIMIFIYGVCGGQLLQDYGDRMHLLFIQSFICLSAPIVAFWLAYRSCRMNIISNDKPCMKQNSLCNSGK